MDKLDLIILISLVILILLIFNSNKIKKTRSNINILSETDLPIDDVNNLNKKLNINITNNEINKITISNGVITRQTILDEIGGSTLYNKLTINSNISGNEIPMNDTKLTYTKLPSKI